MFFHSIWLQEFSGCEVSFILYKILKLVSLTIYRQHLGSLLPFASLPLKTLQPGLRPPVCCLGVLCPLLAPLPTQSSELEIWEPFVHPVSFQASLILTSGLGPCFKCTEALQDIVADSQRHCCGMFGFSGETSVRRPVNYQLGVITVTTPDHFIPFYDFIFVVPVIKGQHHTKSLQKKEGGMWPMDSKVGRVVQGPAGPKVLGHKYLLTCWPNYLALGHSFALGLL